MSKPQNVDFGVIKTLFNADSLYHVTLSFLFGIMIWNTFIGGFVAISTLPRRQFGLLQAKNMPVYFRTALTLAVALLAQWTFGHPDVLSLYAAWRRGDVLQSYSLFIAIISMAVNAFYMEPVTTKLMFQRHKLEYKEGKDYTAPDVSPEMKALTKRFGAAHGVSSLINLVGVVATTFHVMWIGTYGLQKY